MKKASSKGKTKPKTLTYLDILPQDVKKSILKPYQKQIIKNESFLHNDLLYKYNLLLDNTDNNKIRNKLLKNIHKVLNKHGIQLKFVEDDDEYKLEEGETPVPTISLIIDVLTVYLEALISTNEISTSDDIDILNAEMKKYNIPVRIVYSYDQYTKGEFNGFEIIELKNIAHEIDVDKYPDLKIKP